MSNGSLTEAVRRRLALPIEAIQPGQACATCAAPLKTQGTHSKCCRVIEKSNWHTQIQAAVTAVVKEASTLFVRTPVMQTYWPLPPQPPRAVVDIMVFEGDIGFATKKTLAGALIVVDFTITASVKGAELKYEQAGDIANAAEIAEVKQHQTRYDVLNENIIGFAVETSGAWGPAAKRLVWSIAESGGGPQDVVA